MDIIREQFKLLKLFCLFLILLSLTICQAQTIQNNFVHFTEEDGLPSNEVHMILQDHLGYLWIGTNNGLSRYDGYEFLNFSPVLNDSNFLQLPLISSLYEDSDGNIWIGAIGGITKFNRDKETFKLYRLSEFEVEEERTLGVTSICETTNGDILFTVSDFFYRRIINGLYLVENKSDKITAVKLINDDSTNTLLQISNIEDDKYLISGYKGISEYNHIKKSLIWFPFEEETTVISFLQDKNNLLWLGTVNRGIIRYNTADSTYTKFPIINNLNVENDFFGIWKIIFDQNNNLLFTSNKGLIHFDRDSKNVSITSIDPLNPSALHSNDLRYIMQDNSGSIWISSNDAGISKYNLAKNNFRSYYPNPSDPKSIAPGWVNTIFEYDENELWFHSYSRVISRFNKQKEIFNNVTLPLNAEIFDIIRDHENQIWFAGSNGIYKVDAAKWMFETIDIQVDFNENVVFALLEDYKGTFWLGTANGLYTYDRLNASIAKVDFQSLGIGSINSNGVQRLIEDSNNNVWLGTDDGLFNYDTRTKQYTRIGLSENSSKSLTSQDVNALYEDIYGKIWIGTWLGGLNSYDPKNGKFESYTKKDGLKSHSVQGILGDEENGALWLSTFDGISRFDLEKKTFNNFGIEDGIQGNQFADGSALKTTKGEFVFGGSNGITIFKSEDLQSNLVPPKLLIADFKLFNETVKAGDNSPLEKPIYETKKITLNYDENDISFDYLAIHYVNPQKNKYAYRLENYEDEWRYVGNQRTAIYPNLPPGNYIFHLKASNNNEVWNEDGVSLEIEILPPWWQTIWAYVSYFLIFIMGVFVVDRIQRRRLLQKERAASVIKEAELRAVAAEAQAKTAEAQSRVVHAENERKTKELEEARELQLSMLPKNLPNLPNLDIAVYMQTATEVGGDYYDFHVGLDGTLTVVIGDATGHGMKAGTMVTTTKSLFNILAPNPDILTTFSEISRVIKGMQFHQLSMCLMLLKVKGDQLFVSSAAMPPALIYRKKNRAIEEIFMKGMPLGSMNNFPYTIKESHLVKGDTILLLSDGLPELKNESNEMYGYDRTKTEFHSVGEKEPEEIVEHLKNSASQWVNGKDPDDDVTFVVIKVK